MSTIPASTIVNVIPSVVSAGGNALDLSGLFLTSGTRVPIGQVLSFPTLSAVASYFGASSPEYAEAAVYFAGYAGATAVPGAVLFTQCPQGNVSAFLRGASVAALTLSQLQALSGQLGVVVDGYAHGPASINLAAASSFSAAANLIQTGLNAGLTTIAMFNGSIVGNTMTVSSVASGTLAPGQAVAGSTTIAGTSIVSQISGTTGGVGTYALTNVQTLSGTLTTLPASVAVTYDSVSGGFLITSGATGSASAMAYATGSLSTSLALTQTTGAVLSQGAGLSTPAAFMAGVVNQTQDWALFTTLFNPDSVVGVNTNKLAYALWTSQQNGRYGYVPWDTDPTPTLSTSASTSLGFELAAAGYSGTCPVWEQSGGHLAAFVLGTAASINFGQTNGRTTFDFRSQPGLVPGVTDPTTAANLIANGYNFYGAYATANQGFEFFNPGSVSGPFQWMDSYVNQIWLNAQFQLALMELLTNINAVPYNPAGYAIIESALASPIQAGLDFGAFSSGVTLSSSQIAEVNAAAGAAIAPTLQQQGWYLQVKDPGSVVRAARGSPICNFWYVDGEAVQQITLSSVDVP